MAEMWTVEELKSLLEEAASLEGGLLVGLQAVQKEWGYIPPLAIPIIADVFNVSVADVYGTKSFYHEFKDQPAGRVTLKLCQAEACQAVGGRALTAAILEDLGVGLGETNAGNSITVESVYCLGLCATGPAVLEGDRLKSFYTIDQYRQFKNAEDIS